MDHKKLAAQILERVGGQENIQSFYHCSTRLRLRLKDDRKASKDQVSSLEGVIQVVQGGGEFQVVIGSSVSEVHDELNQLTTGDFQEETTPHLEQRKGFKNRFNQAVDIISGIFTPIIGALAGAGIIKGILVILSTTGVLNNQEGSYRILNAAADSVFYFLPIVIALTASRKFKADTIISVIIGAALLYPDLVTLMASGESITFFTVPVLPGVYSSTVIPIIIAIWVLSKLEKFLKRVTPDVIKILVVPALSLAIIVPLTLIVFGPVGNYLGYLLSSSYAFMYHLSPAVAGAFLGGTWAILVIFGLHKVLVPVGINDIARSGQTTIFVFSAAANFAQAGAALGIFFKLKDKKQKSLAGTASLTALFGITEPAIYGFTLKYKKPMIAAVIGGAIGGIITGIAGSRAIAAASPGLMTLPIFFGDGFIGLLIGITVAFLISLLLTIIFGFEEQGDRAEVNQQKESKTTSHHESTDKEILVAPLSGSLISLEKVNDPVFSSKSMGDGFAIIPSEGKLYAPVDGVVATVFPTGHAIGLRGHDGVEILMHVGLETVNLQGKHFSVKVKPDQEVQKGDVLLEFDLEEIIKAGYDSTTPIVITNSQEISRTMKISNKTNIVVGEEVMTLN
ncbi:beta-glucoside-specific PTS transporter subunit IIABC [Bacillus safensis]|uniref:beta-glucoside-specific PTS transporter subunit IIABC n=1 Tax=Bacillus safensis TaxID=561879 RepID=UPI00203A9226|nr:beta-glucoside-specific PTS transporter subunit IIABC [Bacillus safensis]MCM2989399.1 beta-glucoside-specific PTS transporter subunit IIABC [Bacillus safensis]